jgi:hypothetical protein
MKRALVIVLAVVPLLVAAGIAAAGGVGTAKTSTARFHDLDQAKAAGYTVTVADVNGITCISDPAGSGTMGVHMLNPPLLDATIDADAPELLVYAPKPNGELKLVALEYLVLRSVWEAAGNTAPPSLFGQEFMLTPAGNRYGLPDFYALHAWIWNSNPSGLFAPYNPSVNC